MKVTMCFTIDHGLCERLKVTDNASAVVNTLLTQYFDDIDPDFEQKVAEYRLKIKEIKQKKTFFNEKERKKYHTLPKESKKRNIILEPEAQEELNYLHKKFGGVDVLAEKPI